MPLPGGMKAGILSKPYGLQGEVYLILEPGADKFIKTGHPLFIDMDGQQVPFYIEALEMVSERQAVIKFELIHNLEDARGISGKEAYFDKACGPALVTADDPFGTLIGYDAYNQDKEYLGKVVDYAANEVNPLLVIDHDGRELYVPAVSEFILQTDHGERTVSLNLPAGLTSL